MLAEGGAARRGGGVGTLSIPVSCHKLTSEAKPSAFFESQNRLLSAVEANCVCWGERGGY